MPVDAILLIGGDTGLIQTIGAYFERLGAEVSRAPAAADGLALFDRARPDVAVLDVPARDGSGLEVLEQLRRRGCAVLVLTGAGDVESAVRAMQAGAENVLTKPVDLTHLASAVARVSEKVRLARQNALLRARERPAGGVRSLGTSLRMRELERQVELAARSGRGPVFLTGECGSGRGRLARIVHELSPRAAGPFVEVNCGAGYAPILASELFGHEQDALPNAPERKPGLFELADGGTILLDEIGDLVPELQARLVSVLETQAVRRLGGTRELRVDVRVIAATSRDLAADVRAGRFRGDLYRRLSVTSLHLAPVRERSREDRLALVSRLLGELKPQLPGSPTECTADALQCLVAAPWPGNERELRTVLERAMLLARGQPAVGLEHVPPDLRRGTGLGDRRHHPLTLREIERQQIERALRHHGGNRTRTALELGISRATLINKIKAYALNL